jgi:hypothetical protein
MPLELMTSQNLPSALKRSRDRDIDWLSECVQNSSSDQLRIMRGLRAQLLVAWMLPFKMKKTMKAVNATEFRLPWLKEPD